MKKKTYAAIVMKSLLFVMSVSAPVALFCAASDGAAVSDPIITLMCMGKPYAIEQSILKKCEFFQGLIDIYDGLEPKNLTCKVLEETSGVVAVSDSKLPTNSGPIRLLPSGIMAVECSSHLVMFLHDFIKNDGKVSQKMNDFSRKFDIVDLTQMLHCAMYLGLESSLYDKLELFVKRLIIGLKALLVRPMIDHYLAECPVVFKAIDTLEQCNLLHTIPATCLHPTFSLSDCIEHERIAHPHEARYRSHPWKTLLSPNENYVADYANKIVTVWALDGAKNRKKLFEINHNGYRPAHFIFSPDSAYIALMANDGHIQLWDIASRQKIADFLHNNITASNVFIGFDDTASCFYYRPLRGTSNSTLWDIATRKEIVAIQDPLPLYNFDIIFPRETSLCIILGSSVVRVVNKKTGTSFVIPAINIRENYIAVSSNGRFLSVAHSTRLQIWDIEQQICLIDKPKATQCSVLFTSNDDNFIVVSYGHRNFYRCSVYGEELEVSTDNPITFITQSPSKKYIVIKSIPIIHFLNYVEGANIEIANAHPVKSFFFDKKEQLLIINSYNNEATKVLDIQSNSFLFTIAPFDVRSIECDPEDSKRLIIIDQDFNKKIFELPFHKTGKSVSDVHQKFLFYALSRIKSESKTVLLSEPLKAIFDSFPLSLKDQVQSVVRTKRKLSLALEEAEAVAFGSTPIAQVSSNDALAIAALRAELMADDSHGAAAAE